ncbi:TPA: hypothetical protein KOX39_003438 [Clostridioides difficile]|nr:hypothetical protein [Clostridioides difficile]
MIVKIGYWTFIVGLLLKYCNSLPDLLIYWSIALIPYVIFKMIYEMVDYL